MNAGGVSGNGNSHENHGGRSSGKRNAEMVGAPIGLAGHVIRERVNKRTTEAASESVYLFCVCVVY